MLVGITQPPRVGRPGHGLDLRAVRDLTLLAQSVVSGVKLRAMLYIILLRRTKDSHSYCQTKTSMATVNSKAPPTL